MTCIEGAMVFDFASSQRAALASSAMVAALMVRFFGSEAGGRSAKAPLGTVTTVEGHAVVCCVLDGEPYVIVDILFRMLRPRELAAAMGFRESYVWPRSQRDATRLIGNAVSPTIAGPLVMAMLPGGRRGSGAEREAVAA